MSRPRPRAKGPKKPKAPPCARSVAALLEVYSLREVVDHLCNAAKTADVLIASHDLDAEPWQHEALRAFRLSVRAGEIALRGGGDDLLAIAARTLAGPAS